MLPRSFTIACFTLFTIFFGGAEPTDAPLANSELAQKEELNRGTIPIFSRTTGYRHDPARNWGNIELTPRITDGSRCVAPWGDLLCGR